MNNNIFRKKSLERISSPEQLNDYIKVSNPGIWLIITALVIIAISFSIWSVSGNITTEISANGVFQGKSADSIDSVICYVDPNCSQKISEGMPVRIYDKSKSQNTYVNGKVERIAQTAVKQEDILQSYSSEYIADSIMDTEYGVGVLIRINKTLDGTYDWANNEKGDESFIKLNELCKIDIITESITPIEFLFNQSK